MQGLRSIDGRIQVLGDDTVFFEAWENRTRLTLHMEKGQEFDFYIVNAPGQGEFSIVADGDLHRSSLSWCLQSDQRSTNVHVTSCFFHDVS